MHCEFDLESLQASFYSVSKFDFSLSFKAKLTFVFYLPYADYSKLYYGGLILIQPQNYACEILILRVFTNLGVSLS